ncbi:MAG: DUF4381 domain-containing protein [Pseudomonadota bacterium]
MILAQTQPTLDALGLRDIHEPVPIGWWPLGPGWWVVGGILLVAIAVASVYWYREGALRRLARSRLRACVGRWHEQKNDHQLLADLSEWLRRVAIAAHGRAEAAAPVGDAWRRLLDPSGSGLFSDAPASLLIDGVYRPSTPPLDAAQVDTLSKTCEAWLQRVTRTHHREDRP